MWIPLQTHPVCLSPSSMASLCEADIEGRVNLASDQAKSWPSPSHSQIYWLPLFLSHFCLHWERTSLMCRELWLIPLYKESVWSSGWAHVWPCTRSALSFIWTTVSNFESKTCIHSANDTDTVLILSPLVLLNLNLKHTVNILFIGQFYTNWGKYIRSHWT